MLLHDLVAEGRENNFNLMRMLAASAVLVTHSFPLATGLQGTEPLREAYGLTPGSIAVDVFFVISGLLVTASLTRRASALDFVLGRALRILPGLWVMLALTVFVLGPVLTVVPWRSYFLARETWVYLAKCGTLLLDIAYELPGVFMSTPAPRVVNGSLWTMPYEVRMYGLLLLTWGAVGWLARGRTGGGFKHAVTAACLLSGAATCWGHFHPFGWVAFVDLLFKFSCGAALYLHGSRIPLSWKAAAALVLLLAACTPFRDAFYLAYLASVAYLTVCFAYLPGGAIRGYNRVGDYSYGVYIYAFPVQQTLIHLMPGLSVWQLTFEALAVTLCLAIVSWHAVEQPAIAQRSRLKGLLARRSREDLRPMATQR